MIRWGFLALLSHWRRAPVQLIAIVLGLALSTALWSAVQAINATARASYATAQTQLDLFGADRIISKNKDLSVQDYVTLRRAGWLVSPVWEGDAVLAGTKVRLVAIDMLSHPMVATLLDTSGSAASPAPEGTAPILSDLPLFAHPQTFDTPDALPRTVSQTSRLPKDLVVTDFAVLPAVADDIKTLSYLVALAGNTASELPPHLSVSAGSTTSPGQLTDSFHLNLTAFGLLAFVVGLFIVQSTIKLAVEQRRALIRTLRSLGLPLYLMVSLCAAELFALALLAGLIGLTLGYFIAGALLPGVSATLSGLYGAEVAGTLEMRPSWVLWALVMTLGGTAIAGGSSLFQIYKTPILRGPATSARGQTSARARRFAGMAAAGLLGGSLILLYIPHLIAGFALMGALMLGSVLLLPSALAALIILFERRARPGVAEWIWADMRAQLSLLSVPLMALALAIATNIGVETMTSSFRLTFVNWINQRFTADLYIRIETPDMAPDVLAYLTETGHKARPLTVSPLKDAPHPTRIWGVVDDPYYTERWPMVAQSEKAWEHLHLHQGIMVNEQMARARDLWPGASVTLPTVGVLPVLGVYPDYGNPNHQIIMSADTLHRIAPDARTSSISVTSSEITNLLNTLMDTFNLPQTAIQNQEQLRNRSLRIFEQTFVITAALNVLTLGVAGFALLTSFAALWDQRLPQLAPLWAMGVPVHQLALFEVLRSLGLAFLTALFAIPLGLMLAWVLLSVTNVLAFGWQLPLYLFTSGWLRTVVFALLAALLACAPSALRLSRIEPAELLKVFSRER